MIVMKTAGASAVLFYSTGDPAFNSTPPAGDLAESGWQFQGRWGNFVGTPIAPQFFLTAKHVGGAPGDKFILGDREYTAVAFFDSPASDLRLWQIAEQFPTYAPLYQNQGELHQNVVVLGRGTQRGDPIVATAGSDPAVKGWIWGPADRALRWGENRVEAIISDDNVCSGQGDCQPTGDLLRMTFDADKGATECHLSGGDSGGGLFIKEDGVWKLAGINYGVDGPYNPLDLGTGFAAAVFDEGGLYRLVEKQWQLIPDRRVDQPGAFYATRVVHNLAWIQSVINPTQPVPTLQSAPNPDGPFADDPYAEIDTSSRTISVPRTGEMRFYRLRGLPTTRIIGIEHRADRLSLRY